MLCPKCQYDQTKVVDSRETNDNRAIRRRRECEKCEHRFTTYEEVVKTNFLVVKSDESHQPYRREKVLAGIWKACEKRPVKNEEIEHLLDELEMKWAAFGKEVPSKRIGNDVMKLLKKIDEVAYIRYASVYRQFKDVESFKKEIGKLLK